MEYARKNSSLSWFDYLWCRALENFKGESYYTLEHADMDYLLMLNEYLDIKDFISDVDTKDQQNTAKHEAARAKSKGRRG